MGQHAVPRPGRGDGRGVLPGKKHGDEQAGDLVLRERAAPVHVTVAGFNEGLQHVLPHGPSFPPLADDGGEDVLQLFSRPVTPEPSLRHMLSDARYMEVSAHACVSLACLM